MNATMVPVTVKVQHTDDHAEDWIATLHAEDDTGASISLLLSNDVFQQLWAACEHPETADEADDE